MTRSLLVIVVAAAVFTACAKKRDDAPAAVANPVPGAAVPAVAPAKPATDNPNKVYKADEIFTKVAGLEQMDLLEFKPVSVEVTAKAIKDDPAGEYGIDADAGNGHAVTLTFADFGKAAKAKAIKATDTVKATKCQVTKVDGNHLSLVQCALQ